MARILVVDDEAHVCWAYKKMLSARGHEVLVASNAEKGLRLLDEGPELVLLDHRLPGMSGLEALAHFRERMPQLKVILITAHGTLGTSVEAIRLQAYEVLAKPVELARLEEVVDRALGTGETEVDLASDDGGLPLVGKSAPMVECYKRVALVAASDANVLLYGESGTGKELFARTIHNFSQRADGPFETVNCGAIPETLLESELFGHEKGAFTGSVARRVGRLRRADGGTVFLDEIAELSQPAQVKLLRFIEDKRIEPLGGAPVEVSVRLIAATHKDLQREVAVGRFREDLFFRLHVVKLEIPPLRERREDIPALVSSFLRHFSGAAAARISEEALASLQQRAWPGNVRELKNAVEHACLMARGGMLQVRHLPPEREESEELQGDALTALTRQFLDAAEGSEKPWAAVMGRWERALLREALARLGGNLAATARFLGINRLTLRKKLKEQGLYEREA